MGLENHEFCEILDWLRVCGIDVRTIDEFTEEELLEELAKKRKEKDKKSIGIDYIKEIP